MKRFLVYLFVACMILSFSAISETSENMLLPLPDTTMDALENATVAVALSEEDIYMDGDQLRMKLEIFSYDVYDLVDVSVLAPGATMVLCGEEITVESVTDDPESGFLLINGGLYEDGVNLVTYDDTVYFAQAENDSKYWNLVGEADLPVSPDFVYTDSSDLDREEPIVLSADDFMNGHEALDYFFGPGYTTVRIEEGAIVALDRVYTP